MRFRKKIEEMSENTISQNWRFYILKNITRLQDEEVKQEGDYGIIL